MNEGRAAYDAWHRQLATIGSTDETPWHRLVKAALIADRDLRGRRVLEIACGRGELARALARGPARTRLLIGSDFSDAALSIARASHDLAPAVQWVQADAQSIPCVSAAFDTVISCETIEHLAHPLDALHEMARVLKPGGRLFLTFPNFLGPIGLYRAYLRLTGRRYRETGQPINRVTLLPLTLLWLRRCGLAVRSVAAAGHYLPWPRRPPLAVSLPPPVEWILTPFGLHSIVVAEKPEGKPGGARAAP